MADRRVKVVLSAEVQGYRQAMEQAAAATRKTKESAETLGKSTTDASQKAVAAAGKQKQAMADVGQAAVAAGALTLAGVGVAVKSYMDFDKQMSSVQAATHETAGNMTLLRDAAMDAGAKTAFSAVEAAQGIEELAKAGVSTKDILAGGLAGALDLAAAGELAVGEAAEIAATAMTQFKLSGDKIPHVADLLAAGAGKAQGSVQDMGMALNQAGLVASATGLSIEETTGTLAAFASAGLVGSDAGTSFKSMLQKLQNPSLEASSVMSELGISMYDSQGAFVGMSDLAGQLQTNMADLTQAERDKAMATIFGSDAVRASNVLYQQGSAGIQEWVAAVDDAGYAAETAAIKQDNLAGDLEKLGGSFETMLINLGAGADGPLRGFVQGLEDAVTAVGKLPTPVLNAGLGFAAVLGGAALLGGGLITVIPKIADTVGAFRDLSASAPRTASALEKVGKAAGVAAAIGAVGIAIAKVAEASYMDDIDTGMGRVAKSLAEVAQDGPGAAAALDELFQNREGQELVTSVGDLESALTRTFEKDWSQSFNDWGSSVVSTVTGIKGSTEILGDSWDRMDEQLANMVSSGNAEGAATAFEAVKDAAEAQGIPVEKLAEIFPAYEDALAGAAAEQTVAAESADAAAVAIAAEGAAAEEAAALNEEMQEALADIGVSADGAITSLETFVGVMQTAGLLQLSANDAARGYEAAIDSIQTSIDGLIEKNGNLAGVLNDTATGFNIDTEAGREASAAFDQVASSGASLTQALADNGASQAELQASMVSTYDSLIVAAGQFGITGDAADTLARKQMGIPKEVNISTFMDDEAQRRAEETTGAVEGVPDQVEVKSWMDGAAKAMADATTGAANAIPNQETIDSWMSDAAFVEALRTRAAALGIPEQEVIDSFMSSAARDEADATTARVLGIPPGVSVSSYMDAYARIEAQNTKAAIDAIPSYKESRIVVVTERNELVRTGQVGMRAMGGRIPRNATGGRLPSTGPGTDRTDGILGLSAMTGAPVSWLDGGEWIVNAKSSDKHHNLIGAINRDDPRLANLQGFAAGGRMSRDYAPPSYVAGTSGAAPIQYNTTIDAAPGVAYEYAKEVGRAAVQRQRDAQAAYGN